jgi:RNA polymerase sigma-70 factor (ECF subfamily)
VLDELAECITEDDRALSPAEELALRDAVNCFLASLPVRTRRVFLYRYWQLLPVAEVARACGMRESAVKVLLHRTRQKFKEYLEKEDIPL